MTNSRADNPYLHVIETFSPEELALVAQVKRFFECVQGDPGLRADIESGTVRPEQAERLKRIGVSFDLDEVALLREEPEAVGHFLGGLRCSRSCEPPDEVPEIFRGSRPLDAWARLLLRRAQIWSTLSEETCRLSGSPKLDAWRLRRIAAVKSELGFFGGMIDHPLLAFELGDGCSVGCWFCAFATRKLTRNFDYLENGELFRDVARACVDLFGKEPANAALLYYGTEPHDNPHYLDFVKDYADITGGPVCTSTAVPTDAKWLRELLAYYGQWALPWPRLSVLSEGMLRTIHDLYSPEELRDVELLMQMKDQPRKKVTGGRILEEQAGLRGREEGHYLDDVVPQGSIACVSGFLINMVHRTIRLVSPCYTGERWPYGYRVFDESTFTDAGDFPDAVSRLIERNMPHTPSPDAPARFRDDFVYRPTEEGFDLVSPNQLHRFRSKEVYQPLGRLMAADGITYGGLYKAMVAEHGLDAMVGVALVKKLFDGGFLDEVRPASADSGGTGSEESSRHRRSP